MLVEKWSRQKACPKLWSEKRCDPMKSFDLDLFVRPHKLQKCFYALIFKKTPLLGEIFFVLGIASPTCLIPIHNVENKFSVPQRRKLISIGTDVFGRSTWSVPSASRPMCVKITCGGGGEEGGEKKSLRSILLIQGILSSRLWIWKQFWVTISHLILPF